MNLEGSKPTALVLRRLAVKYDVDPRSIQKELKARGSVRGAAGERARLAAAELSPSSAAGEAP